MKAARLLAENVSSLLSGRRQKQTELAKWCRKSDPWVSQFLRGERNWMLEDLDRVADFFGLATYQLFQPGISSVTERRHGERRIGRERRIAMEKRLLGRLTDAVDAARPIAQRGAHDDRRSAAIERLARDMQRQLGAILASSELGGQTAASRKALPKARVGTGTTGRPAPEGSKE